MWKAVAMDYFRYIPVSAWKNKIAAWNNTVKIAGLQRVWITTLPCYLKQSHLQEYNPVLGAGVVSRDCWHRRVSVGHENWLMAQSFQRGKFTTAHFHSKCKRANVTSCFTYNSTRRFLDRDFWFGCSYYNAQFRVSEHLSIIIYANLVTANKGTEHDVT